MNQSILMPRFCIGRSIDKVRDFCKCYDHRQSLQRNQSCRYTVTGEITRPPRDRLHRDNNNQTPPTSFFLFHVKFHTAIKLLRKCSVFCANLNNRWLNADLHEDILVQDVYKEEIYYLFDFYSVVASYKSIRYHILSHMTQMCKLNIEIYTIQTIYIKW